MNTLRPCSQCGTPGLRNLGSRGYCATHLAALFASFPPEAWATVGGVGLPERCRPDHGPEFFDLTCSCCGATWTGPALERCRWCHDTRAALVAQRARQVLEPPDVDPDDERYDDRMAGWARRLVVAIDAGIVTEAQADRAWRRAQPTAVS